MTNIMNFLIAHWAVILGVLAVLHTAVSTVLGLLNKPKAETTFESIWHYVQIVCGLGTKLVVSKSPTALSGLTGDAANLAAGK